MRVAFINALLGLAALVLAPCGTPENSKEMNTGAGASKPAAAAPTADALLALDQQVSRAYLTGDSKLFEGMLNDKFVMRDRGRQIDTTAAVDLIASNECNVKDWKIEDPLMARIDADTYVLSDRATFDGVCTGPDRKPMRIPSPIRAATVWIRAGDTWRAAFRGQNRIFDPKNPPSPAKGTVEGRSTKDDRAVARAEVAADPGTVAMMAVEKAFGKPGWQRTPRSSVSSRHQTCRSKTYMAPILRTRPTR